MTREEAALVLNYARPQTREADKQFYDDEDLNNALDMGIKAIMQEPCEDCISRKAIMKKAKGRYSENGTEGYVDIEDIEDAPSVTPTRKKGKWIPCSERLPEEMGTYMTTIDYGEHGLVAGQRYYYGKGLKWNDECVIAWMPLPEPYNAEMEGEE